MPAKRDDISADDIHLLRDNGYTWAEIAEKYECSVSTVVRRAEIGPVDDKVKRANKALEKAHTAAFPKQEVLQRFAQDCADLGISRVVIDLEHNIIEVTEKHKETFSIEKSQSHA